MFNKGNIISKIASGVLFTLLTILMPTSCDIYEGLDPCPRGVNLRFVFDYNMEYANAFPSKVDCYTLFIYDEQGNFLSSYSEEGDKLRDENYRLQIDLPDGKYQFVAYGGMECDRRSFEPVAVPHTGSKLNDLKVMMHHKDLTSDQALHDFYYGAADVTIEEDLYRETTIKLVRNTNNIRVLLQHLNGESIPMDKFEVKIADDNSLFDAENNLIPNGIITYFPWSSGVTSKSKADGSKKEINAGYAEFSTSRLSIESNNRLIVSRIEDKQVVLSIPLNKYLLLLKSDRYDKMESQEFLDRENDWSLVFFLDSRYKWINTQIIVNGWTVRLNDADF